MRYHNAPEATAVVKQRRAKPRPFHAVERRSATRQEIAALRRFCDNLRREEAARAERLGRIDWPDLDNIPLGAGAGRG